jgi:citrate/tricarballylate utilization protein
MRATEALAEADRLMTVCNSCRYCEGLCAVFPAMESRRVFNDNDLSYLSNLCHNCGACYIDCQYSPPHPFDVNVPRAFSRLRFESYARYAWPIAASGAFRRNGLIIAITSALCIASFFISFASYDDPTKLFRAQEEGSFYALMRHDTMVVIFGAAFFYSVLAMLMSARTCWRDMSGSNSLPSASPLWQAVKDSVKLRYLDGGGSGCYIADEPPDHRRTYHHFTMYGFIFCFASTCTATLYHVLLHREPPFPWWDIPVVLGTVGGLGLAIGTGGLFLAKRQQNDALKDQESYSMDLAFIAMLFASSVTGLALLILRHTPAMGILLAIHLGVIFALFITMPYSKFIHGLYRFIALIHYACEVEASGRGAAASAPKCAIPEPVSPAGTKHG